MNKRVFCWVVFLVSWFVGWFVCFVVIVFKHTLLLASLCINKDLAYTFLDDTPLTINTGLQENHRGDSAISKFQIKGC